MDKGTHRSDARRATRSQSDLIAVVLLAGMVIAGATVVVVAGSAAINQGRGESSVVSAEQSIQSLRAAIQDSSREASIELPKGDGQVTLVDRSPGDPARAGYVTVTVDPPSGPSKTEDVWLGTLRYERDGRTVAYQGGGVWRKTGDSSVVVSPPPVSFRTKNGPNTLTVQFVNLTGEMAGSELRITNSTRQKLSKLGLGSYVKPGTTIEIKIWSEYYRAWAETFASKLGDGAVTVDEADQRVTVTVKSPRSSSAPSAVLGTDPGGDMTISNFGATDSYNSSTGPYPGFPNDLNADVLTKGEIKPSNKMSVRGDVIAEKGIGTTNNQIPNKLKIEGRMILGDDPDLGSTDYLKVSAKSKHYSGPTFEGLFSTQDNLHILKGTEFGDDVLVGGKFKVTGSKRPQIDGNLVVTGGIPEISQANIGGDVYVDGPADDIASRDTVDIDGSIYVNGDVDMTADAQVGGKIYYPVGHTASVPPSLAPKLEQKSQSWIDAKLDYGSPPPQKPIVPNVPSRPSATSEINSVASTIPGSNDNAAEPVISGKKLDFSAADTTLGPGRYHLERLNVPGGETLTLDTTGGDVVIYVEDHTNTGLRVNGKIQVQGADPSNRVRIYVDDSPGEDSDREVEITGSGEVSVPNDRSPNMWVYLKPTADVNFNTHAVFQGVMYGAGSGNGADIQVNNHVDVFGALLGDVFKIPNHARIHYDEALADDSAFSGGSGSATIAYVHFGERTAVVEG